tara:strand:- start:103 stop:8574 length:8472 start_codon:yes stop_codon:yes gene_type:complete
MTAAAAPQAEAEGPRALALRHKTVAGPPAMIDGLRAVSSLTGWLERVRRYCADPAPEYSRAADWLLDNDYQIARAFRRLKEDMPPDYYRKLVALDEPKGANLPRIFDLSQAVFDGLRPQLTLPDLTDFIQEYQQTSGLTNAELWALPSMLRLVSIERLIFAFEAIQPDLAPQIRLSAATKNADRTDPVDQIGQAITNLIVIDSIKWADFVDETSCIEAELGRDPAGIYRNMTFETRDRYRTAVEQLAQRCEFSEPEVAQSAVRKCQRENEDSAGFHVGFWLIGDGLSSLETTLGYRVPPALAIRRRLSGRSGAIYASSLIAGVLVALVVPLAYLMLHDATLFQLALGIVVSLVPGTVLSVWAVHWIITKVARPKTLPEMDFSKSVPTQYATAIVVPVIVGSKAEAHRIVDQLEVLGLANPDPALRFVVLSDPVDADTQVLPDDAGIEKVLADRVQDLNRRHGKGRDGPFFLLHRRRIFNVSEDCWMAWERKRGKLEEFNRLVLGEDTDAFAITAGPTNILRGSRFAITLDADTQVPPGMANRLIGIMAHPLNRAQPDPDSGRIVAGHAILQPRIEILPKLGNDTHFSHLYGGDTAVDIYSRAVSDVYQDLFGTGIFVGKGIYDIAALHGVMTGCIPENYILSHDLFEGLHGRAALASNLVLYEDLPATYPDFAMRQHRWMRGDWQLLPWLRRRVPDGSGGTCINKLSPLDRWKMVDNLRRSLVPPALLLFFLGAWLVLPGSALVWTLLAIAAPGSYLLGELFAIATGGIRRGVLGSAIHQLKAKGGRWFFSIIFLVSDTLIALDAVFRTLWRVGVTGRNRLEWTSAAHASATLSYLNIRRASWRLMWPSSALALTLGGHLALYNPQGFWPALPVLVLWLLAPEISVWSARPRFFRSETLDEKQRHFLRLVARRTWHFFETFVGPDDNWLPPDNYQHGHKEEIAHRTSPTNIGMFLVSALAARDLGFITTSDFLARCRNTMDALDRVATYHGHILNWYDTQTLEPLEPQYVSTVDSGNLAVALIALKQGCLELSQQPTVGRACFGCLNTTLDLLVDAIRDLPERDDVRLHEIESAIRDAVDRASTSPLHWGTSLTTLSVPLWLQLETLVRECIEASPDMPETQEAGITAWLDRYHHDLHAIARDIDTFAPWVPVISKAPSDLAPFARLVASLLHPQELNSVSGDAFDDVVARIDAMQGDTLHEAGEDARWLNTLRTSVQAGSAEQATLREGLADLAKRADLLAYGMDFSFLYDPSVRLFTIGYNQSLGQMDKSHYDLLATEARLASYFAIAKHDAPIEHWFSFSRPITRLEGKPSILSWNGSMFEYLMPPLFLPSHRDTLLGESELTAIDFQRTYALERSVPWGISESAFGATDHAGTYQYRAFGVPGLGIRRGLTEDLVVAPYGSALALCGLPASATKNLQALADLGAMTFYGFFDALDFTPNRTPPGRDFVPVKTYMSHHQGMILAAITNAVRDDVMVRRFLREKPVQAMELLLQERVPWDVPIERGRADETWERHAVKNPVPDLAPWVPSPEFAVPQVHLLGNGRMSSLISDAGGGGLKWEQIALTRWQADPTRTAQGIWLYFRDQGTTDMWSLGTAPTGRETGETKCIFHQHMVELLRHHEGIVARMDITVAPFEDVEIRRVTVMNESDQARTIDLTTYAEVVLAPPLEDERHPAFSKLFVKSRYLEDRQALFFERRPRRPETRPPVLLHKLVSDDPAIAITGWETDRARFLGRNQSERAPQGLDEGLSGTDGWTLDPVMALQVRLRLKPMETKVLTFLTIAGTSRRQVLQVAARYPSAAIDRAFREALVEAGRAVQRLQIDPVHLPELQVLSSLLTHVDNTLRGAPPDNADEWNGQPDLWRFGISGDLPILLMKVVLTEEPSFLDLLIRAQRLWDRGGLQVDLVILRDAASGYEEPLRERVLSILRDTQSESVLGMRGGIHLVAADQMSAGLQRGLEATAHVVLTDDHQTLRETLDRALETRVPPPRFSPGPALDYDAVPLLERPQELLFDNGYGGFEAESGDYLIHLAPGTRTPAPWCNVLSNDDFGCLVSEAGFGMTWAVNSGEHRLTPWSNDPVTDRPGEVLYLRDEASGEVWTPTPEPMGQGTVCQIRHGAGTTQWRQNSHGLEQEVLAFVPVDASVKLVRLRLTNRSGQMRRISATYYVEWLLGAMTSVSRPHVISRYDPELKAILGRNRWNPEFGDRIAYLTASVDARSVTGDRHDFLGRDGDVSDPDSLRRWDLGGRFTAGGDPCAAYQVHLDLAAGESSELVFALGETADDASLAAAVERWKRPSEFDQAHSRLVETWTDRLGAVQVKTPDPAFDLMVNRWLPYQNRSCRIMARAGFYQAGGAYGFRDQLQDVLALLHSDPDRVRQHILLAAGYQFEEGDVLHWWHPPDGRGVRTRCSDDYLWLVFVTARYVDVSADIGILEAIVPFLSAPELRPDEQDRYALFGEGEDAPLYDHCARALDRMMATGSHGLPLMGAGDWNDGMDRIGEKGRGESVWLAWFQIATVALFAPLAEKIGHSEDAKRWQDHAIGLRQALAKHAWDGAWYVRAFDDDGVPWGARENDECRIDLIAQAWSVLTGGPADDRAHQALQSAHEQLVEPEARLIRLLAPPFDKTDRDPGYIQAYPPGIRENGGQYTHAAAWLGAAYVAIGDGNRAYQIFDLINPVRRTADKEGADHYRTEPYVLTGDVSGVGARTGQGGWSWYTGAAGWTWQLAVAGILGVKPEAGAVCINPCLPTRWGRAEVTLDGPLGRLEIIIECSDKTGGMNSQITVDGKPWSSTTVPFPGAGRTSRVTVKIQDDPSRKHKATDRAD